MRNEVSATKEWDLGVPEPWGGPWRRGAIPAPATPLVGREVELGAISELLETRSARLITLVGPGGIGKTRLALAAVQGMDTPCAFISLADITDPQHIMTAIGQALGVESSGETQVQAALQDALRGRDALLVIDNVEQVIEGAPRLANLLQGCEDLRLLVTSRLRLALQGEHVIPVEPLALPATSDVADVAAASAGQVFLQRARAANPAFTLTSANASAVATICHRLDGLPLAIELAAARSNMLTPEAIVTRLERRLHLLTGGPVESPPRLQTMRAAIDWSHSLLEPPVRRFWEWLGVFAGGFTADAAEEVAGGSEASSIDSLATLQSLVNQNLLHLGTTATGIPRFGMMETTREFALEALAARGDEPGAQAAHAAWVLHQTRALEPGLTGPDPDPWFSQTEVDIANIRAALTWLHDCGEIDGALEIVLRLAWFWTAPNYTTEGRTWCGRLLAAAGASTSPDLLADACQTAGDLANWQGDVEAAYRLLEEARTRWQAIGNEDKVAATLRSLGSVAIDRGELTDAIDLLTRAHELASRTGNAWEAAASANLLGVALSAMTRYTEAIPWHETASSGWQGLGSTAHMLTALVALGFAHLGARNNPRAFECFDAVLAMEHEPDFTYDSCLALAGIGCLADRWDHPEASVRLHASAMTQLERLSTPLRPHVRQLIVPPVNALRRSLGTGRFAIAWRQGQDLAKEAAVREAQAIEAPTPALIDGLTQRERDVIALLVEGQSDAEIADRLFITRRTASKHVAMILDKLGAPNRTAAAVLAAQHLERRRK